jgi:hypothetical protein
MKFYALTGFGVGCALFSDKVYTNFEDVFVRHSVNKREAELMVKDSGTMKAMKFMLKGQVETLAEILPAGPGIQVNLPAALYAGGFGLGFAKPKEAEEPLRIFYAKVPQYKKDAVRNLEHLIKRFADIFPGIWSEKEIQKTLRQVQSKTTAEA